MAVLSAAPELPTIITNTSPQSTASITKLLGVEDVAYIIASPPSDVYELLRTGQIRAIKRGKGRPSHMPAQYGESRALGRTII